MWVDGMQISTRIIQWQNIIYDIGNTNGSLDLFAVESHRGDLDWLSYIAVSQIGEMDYSLPQFSPLM